MLFEAIPLGRENETIEVLLRLGACPFVIKGANAYIDAMLNIYMHRKAERIEFEDPPAPPKAPDHPRHPTDTVERRAKRKPPIGVRCRR